MVNRVILVGTLTRDAETLLSARGPIARMRLATSSVWRDSDGNRNEAKEFHNLVALNKRLAEICGTHCLKGRRVYVEGQLRTREYEGADGLRRTSTEVVVDTMRVLDSHQGENGDDLIPPGGSVPHTPAGSGRPEPVGAEAR